MSYSEHHARHVRLTVLRLLAAQPGYGANDSVLLDSLAAYGFRLPRDRVRTEIAWLAEQGLVTSEDVDGLLIVTVTRRGLDVAAGLATVPGVQRPSPAA